MNKVRVTAQMRRIVRERAGGYCEYCRCSVRFSPQPFSVEHIVPRSKGGETELDNLAFSCQGCNNLKYNKLFAYDPVTRRFVPLFHPRQQEWHEHFIWNYDYTMVIGVTPVGRATVEALQLNREGLLNLRHLLHKAKQHPPKLS